MGRLTSRGCARNDRITFDFISCDPVVPGTATRRDSTHPSDQVTKVMMCMYARIHHSLEGLRDPTFVASSWSLIAEHTCFIPRNPGNSFSDYIL